MSKQEFIDSLRRELSGMEDYEYVNDTVNYYENYIESEIRKGNTEATVLEGLGDARLIAKSIKASKRSAGQTVYEDPVMDERTTENNQSTGLTILSKFLNLPTWTRRLVGGAVIIGGLIVAGTVLSWMFPVLLVGGIAYVFYRFIRDNFLQ